MRIGVVGGGVVGQATARSYLEHVEEVRVWDVVRERRTHSLDAVLDCNLIFVCLPTPQKEGSLECDLSAVEGFFRQVHSMGDISPYSKFFPIRANYVLRSTVPIGTTRRLRERYGLTNLVHNPEFLTARCAFTDAQIPARNIIGCESWSIEDRTDTCEAKLYDLYESRFPGVPICVMRSDESEAVKLIQNGIFAVTVSYWNEARCLTDALGLDWDRVQEAILLDGRISRAHVKVPGHHGFGFAGACLPKDLANLISCFHKLQVTPPYVCEAAQSRNTEDRQR